MKRLLKHITIFFIIFTALLSGCIESINTESEIVSPELVVDGWIRTDKVFQQVKLSYTKEIGVFRTDDEINANVYIRDDNGNKYYLYNSGNNTFITLGGDLIPEIGRSYTLNIVMGNKRIQSTPETLHPVTEIDSIYFDFIEETRFDPSTGLDRDVKYFEIYVDLQDPLNETNYYLWQNRGVIEYWTKIPIVIGGPPPQWPTRCFKCMDPITDDIFLEEDRFIDGKKILKKKISKIGTARMEPLMFVANQFSLTRDAYEYLKQLQLQIDNSGSIFDAPPGLILGNLYNPDDPKERIYGYFKVSDVEEAKIYIQRYSYPNSGYDKLAEKDCRTEPGATDVMPQEYKDFLDSIGK